MRRVYLTPQEFRHYTDLFEGLGQFKLTGEESPAEIRERKVTALQSVIQEDNPRARIGSDEVEVFGTRSEKSMPRWQ